jgi:hypothetical protein
MEGSGAGFVPIITDPDPDPGCPKTSGPGSETLVPVLKDYLSNN